MKNSNLKLFFFVGIIEYEVKHKYFENWFWGESVLGKTKPKVVFILEYI